MKVGDLVIVLPYEVKLRARWNNETKSEDYIGQCGAVTEVMEEFYGEPLTSTHAYVEFGDGFVGLYSLDNLEILRSYNPLSIDEDFYITPREVKPKEFSQEQEDKDIAYLRKNLFESFCLRFASKTTIRITKDYLNENYIKCFYCSSVFSINQFDDDYAICGKCRDKENEE